MARRGGREIPTKPKHLLPKWLLGQCRGQVSDVVKPSSLLISQSVAHLS